MVFFFNGYHFIRLSQRFLLSFYHFYIGENAIMQIQLIKKRNFMYLHVSVGYTKLFSKHREEGTAFVIS